MKRLLAPVAVMAVVMITLAGCATTLGRAGTGAGPTGPAASGLSDHGAIYAAVIRHYLTSGDSSFPASFAHTFVLKVADEFEADPIPRPTPAADHTEAISATDQVALASALADVTSVEFVNAPADVIEVHTGGCGQVRDGGILITLGPPAGTGERVTVAVYGFVACLGASWLTYVVERTDGAWRVTGTTGPQAVA